MLPRLCSSLMMRYERSAIHLTGAVWLDLPPAVIE
jgi:hypothetical protein